MAKIRKVLVVDDTALYRKILSEAIGRIPDLELVGTAPRGSIALEMLKRTPVDIVLVDMFMPEMDGLETLQCIKQAKPSTAVVMVSGATTRDAHITIKALEKGAAEFIPKPQAKSIEEGMNHLTAEIKRVADSLAHFTSAPPLSRTASPLPPRLPPPPLRSKGALPTTFDLLLIGVSTGGPKALSVVIPKLPADLRVPVLIVQHMPPMFTASLAEHLDRDSALNVREAKEGEAIEPGSVLIAPGGHHMAVKRKASGLCVALNDDPPENSCRPAVDVLFRSVANTLNGSVLSVILTGMGEDGARGVADLKRQRAYCLSQSKETCVVYGMPQAIESRGLADEVLHLEEMASRITQLINRR